MMGSVIHLASGSGRERATAARKRKRQKTALVLGGGGITGAAYHLGVLNAMNAMSETRTVNDFDLYVGTSAGGVIAAFLANGIPPEELIFSNLGENGTLPQIGADEIMLPDRRGLMRSAVRWPLSLLGALRRYAGHPFTTSLIDGLGALAEGLPPALYTTDGTERYLRKTLEEPGRSNSFETVERQLLITATDLDSARRVVFGADEGPSATISEAAAASTAIPLLYSPRRIGRRVYLDGGLRSTTNIDVAIGHGARLVICVNPLVPFIHDVRNLLPSATGLDARYISEKGWPHIAAQTFRIMAQAQVEKEIELARHAHPDVDIILIEPRSDDEHMFIFNLMDYASRERVARHAFETVAIDLVTRYPDYKVVLGRHGIEISRDRLIEQLQNVVEGSEPRFYPGTSGSGRDATPASRDAATPPG